MVINLIYRSSPGKQIPDKKWKSRKSFFSASLWRWTSYPATISENGYPNKKKKKDTANDVSLSSFGRHYSFL
jgi:hypothetical protein